MHWHHDRDAARLLPAPTSEVYRHWCFSPQASCAISAQCCSTAALDSRLACRASTRTWRGTPIGAGPVSSQEPCVHGSCRGHTVKAVCESFHLAKDAGFKVVTHMMPDLPNMGLERDIEGFIVCMSNLAAVAMGVVTIDRSTLRTRRSAVMGSRSTPRWSSAAPVSSPPCMHCRLSDGGHRPL